MFSGFALLSSVCTGNSRNIPLTGTSHFHVIPHAHPPNHQKSQCCVTEWVLARNPAPLWVCMYKCLHKHTHTHTHTYIYIISAFCCRLLSFGIFRRTVYFPQQAGDTGGSRNRLRTVTLGDSPPNVAATQQQTRCRSCRSSLLHGYCLTLWRLMTHIGVVPHR